MNFFPFYLDIFGALQTHIVKVLKTEPHCDINPPLLSTHFQMTSECAHSRLNSVNAILRLPSGKLSLLGQSSGEKQMAAPQPPQQEMAFLLGATFL